MPIDQFHVRIGNSALLFMLIAGVWGLWRWRQHRSVDASYRGLLLVGELLLIAQGLVGAYMWLFLNRDAVLVRPAMHILYGILTVIALPAAFSFASGKIDGEREQALYAFVCLFLAGLVWRAQTTGVNVDEGAALTGAILLLAGRRATPGVGLFHLPHPVLGVDVEVADVGGGDLEGETRG